MRSTIASINTRWQKNREAHYF